MAAPLRQNLRSPASRHFCPLRSPPSVAEGKAPVLRVTRNAQYRDIDGGRIASFCPLALRSATPSKPYPSKPVSASVYADQCRKLTANDCRQPPASKTAIRLPHKGVANGAVRHKSRSKVNQRFISHPPLAEPPFASITAVLPQRTSPPLLQRARLPSCE